MNKLTAIILLAMVGSATAGAINLIDLEDPETQLSLTPGDDEEVQYLIGDATIFRDFCVKSRSAVINDIKSQSNALASTIFSLFFKNAGEIGQNALNVEEDAVERLANQLRDPSSAIESAPEGDLSGQTIADGQHKIQDEQTLPRTFFQAVVSTIGATGNSIASGVVSGLNDLKANFGLNKVGGAIAYVCQQIEKYEQQNRDAFGEFAKSIAAKSPVLGATPFESVPCLTTRRISRLDGVCKFAAVTKGPAEKIYNSLH